MTNEISSFNYDLGVINSVSVNTSVGYLHFFDIVNSIAINREVPILLPQIGFTSLENITSHITESYCTSVFCWFFCMNLHCTFNNDWTNIYRSNPKGFPFLIILTSSCYSLSFS